jgi:hypothetical protein
MLIYVYIYVFIKRIFKLLIFCPFFVIQHLLHHFVVFGLVFVHLIMVYLKCLHS